MANSTLTFTKTDTQTQIAQKAIDNGDSTYALQVSAGQTAVVAAATMIRPTDTTPYASGDLVANSVTAGSVTPLSFAVGRGTGGVGGMIRRCRIIASKTADVTNASFRLHLYSSSPTPSNGDNAAWLSDKAANYMGAIDVTLDKIFTDGSAGVGSPNTGSDINFEAATIYGLLEARAAYTPTNAETFIVKLETLQN